MSPARAILAECSTCGWRSAAPNARATAARHARQHRHDVTLVETVHHRHAAPPPGQTALDDVGQPPSIDTTP